MFFVSNIIEEDINQIVVLHISSFPNFFLTSLGDKFLNLFYKTCLNNKHCVSIKLVDENKVILGFAIGTDISSGFYKQIILSELISFIKVTFILLVTRPKALYRLVKNLRKGSHDYDIGNSPELLSIAVSECAKGKGIADLLLTSFENILISKGCKKVTLTTDFYENERAINFYYKNGYRVIYDFMAFPHRKMLRLEKVF